jgi:hypothetical protein
MTEEITRRTELAHRSNDGVDVYLFWDERTNRVTVDVLDAKAGESFVLEIDGGDALDAFNHPYAYATRLTPDRGAWTEGLAASVNSARNSHKRTTNPRRNDHARTDR